MELRFTVWQFVRLMVHLEEHPAQSATAKALYAAWADVWAALDRDLARLAQDDMDAYSEMMLDQDVVIEDATPDQVATAKAALEAVIAEMDRALEAEAEKTMLDSLKFERRELHQLSRKLGRQVQA